MPLVVLVVRFMEVMQGADHVAPEEIIHERINGDRPIGSFGKDNP